MYAIIFPVISISILSRKLHRLLPPAAAAGRSSDQARREKNGGLVGWFNNVPSQWKILHPA